MVMWGKRGILLLILLLIIPTTLAVNGCFTYKNSYFYCTDLDEKSAKEECALSSNCNINTHFSKAKSCNSLLDFPQCEEVYCKDSCSYQFSGKCFSGKVPATKEKEWCSAGCCKIDGTCTYQKSK